MSGHTKGPWNIKWELDQRNDRLWGLIAHVPNELPGHRAHVWESILVDGDNKEANAARIVACVNACEGLDDPQALRADNARLREALANLLADATSFGMADSKYSGVLIEARAALAKVES